MEGEFLMSRPSAECQYSGDYVTADLCKVFEFVFDGNHHVLRLTAPRLWYLLFLSCLLLPNLELLFGQGFFH